jgi:hypothetical protein
MTTHAAKTAARPAGTHICATGEHLPHSQKRPKMLISISQPLFCFDSWPGSFVSGHEPA